MPHQLIVIEGIDNVGKSETCLALATIMNQRGIPAVYYRTPPKTFDEATRVINATAKTDAHFLYHLAMVKYAEQEVDELLRDRSVVCDRWFYSTFAYHMAKGSKLGITLDTLVSIKPTHIFLLVVKDEAERIRRGKSKPRPQKHDLKTKLEEPLLSEVEYILLNSGFHVIDNTRLGITEVIEEILKLIVGRT